MKINLKQNVNSVTSEFKTRRKSPKSCITTSMISHLESRCNKEHEKCEERKVQRKRNGVPPNDVEVD